MSVRDLILRDSFCAQEIDIFQAVCEWAEHNQGADPTPILEAVRLPLMTMNQLLNVVRDTGLVSSDSILDAIKLQTECRDMDLKYRGFLCKCLDMDLKYQGFLCKCQDMDLKYQRIFV